MVRAAGLALFVTLFAGACCSAQTINTSCTLYPNAAYCTSTASDGGAALAAEQRREQYETGQAIGNALGMAIFRAHFPGWRRKYCSTHPGQPFYYGNASGDSIRGTCPSLQGLANEAAAEFVGKHRASVKSMEHAAAIDRYIGENNLPPWQPKSYEKAAKATANSFLGTTLAATTPPVTTAQQPPAQSLPQDVFWWFDESGPTPGAPLFEVVVTSRAYDGALGILRQARQGDTAVQAGASILDTGYHPATFSLSAWQKSNPKATPTMFYWQGEDVNDSTPVMHFEMTKRAYEQMLALTAGSDLRVRPSQGR